LLRKIAVEIRCGKFRRKIAAENLGGHTEFMRLVIYDRTMADVEISAPGKISAPLKFPRLSKKFERKSLAPSYYLGSAESPTADFLQVWLKSSRSVDVLILRHVDLK
jgi:hypothetical protein